MAPHVHAAGSRRSRSRSGAGVGESALSAPPVYHDPGGHGLWGPPKKSPFTPATVSIELTLSSSCPASRAPGDRALSEHRRGEPGAADDHRVATVRGQLRVALEAHAGHQRDRLLGRGERTRSALETTAQARRRRMTPIEASRRVERSAAQRPSRPGAARAPGRAGSSAAGLHSARCRTHGRTADGPKHRLEPPARVDPVACVTVTVPRASRNVELPASSKPPVTTTRALPRL